MPPPPRAQVFTDYRCATSVAANLQGRALRLGQRIVEIRLPELLQMVPRTRIVFHQKAREGLQILYARNCRGTLREAVQRKIGCQRRPCQKPYLHTDKNTSEQGYLAADILPFRVALPAPTVEVAVNYPGA